MPIVWNHLCVRIVVDQTSGAAGARSAHAHGLTYAPNVNHCFCQPKAADDDANAANGSVCVVKTDATSVYVKSNVTNTPFNLVIVLDKDDGNQRTA